METNLRPLNLGEIMDRTAQLYRENFLLFAGIAAVYAGALLVLRLVFLGVQHWMQVQHMARAQVWFTVISLAIIWGAILILGGLSVAANNRAVAWVHLSQPATIRGAYSSVFQRLGRYVWLMVITTTLVWLPVILLYAGYLLYILLYVGPKAVAAGGHADSHLHAVTLLVSVIFLLLLVPGLVYGIVMSLRYSLAVPACVVEDLKARKSIRRSIALSKGSRGRIFGFLILVIVIHLLLLILGEFSFVVVGIRHHGHLSLGLRSAQQVAAFFVNTFMGPVYAIGFTLFYYDQRVRGEGFDIERMMQAAGMTPTPRELPAAEPAEAPPADPQPEGAHE